jgi:cobalamin biosynthesis Mg chelatase CobN
MGQRTSSGVRPSGLGRGFKNAARLLLGAGLVMLAVGFFAGAASASSSHHVVEPKLTSHKATFLIPANHPPTVVWELHLWANGNQKRLGTDSGTSGKLVVKVPTIPGCTFQVDVTKSDKFYSGFQRQLQNCGKTSPSTTTTTTSSTTTSTTDRIPSTTTTQKPKTKGGHGGTTTTTSGSGTSPGGGSTTPGSGSSSAPSGALAFTGAGPGMWFLAALGALFILAGSLLLLYARRYPQRVF